MILRKQRQRLAVMRNRLPEYPEAHIVAMDAYQQRGSKAFIHWPGAGGHGFGTAHCANLRPAMNDIMGHG